MKLKKLITDFPDLTIKGSKDIEVSGICTDSKKVFPKNIFFALKGKDHDGSTYIYEAVLNGAVAIVADFFDPFLKNVVQIITDDPYKLLKAFADIFYQLPALKLNLVGITGTNGKTTTSFLIKHIIEKINKKCGLIGTNEYHVGGSIYPASFTTPPYDVTTKFLKEMVDSSCEFAVMEVSSHGLVQKRCDTLDFDVAIYTNLTEEHLDYHLSMRSYADAKKIFFQILDKSAKDKKVAIVNQDCIWHRHMIDNSQTAIITYGIESEADVRATAIKLNSNGGNFTINYKNTSQHFTTKLVGRFNIYNILAAVSYGLFLGITLETLASLIKDFSNVKGRMELVKTSRAKIFVDFAHTPNALENCLKALLEIKKKRIITVFGCGGNRDAYKRPKMAEIAERYSDKVIVTNDNPRREDPEKILGEIITGFKLRSSYDVILDRAKAIEQAIEFADSDDIILIAGKGHETKQIFAYKTIDFDDIEVVKNILNNLCV